MLNTDGAFKVRLALRPWAFALDSHEISFEMVLWNTDLWLSYQFLLNCLVNRNDMY